MGGRVPARVRRKDSPEGLIFEHTQIPHCPEWSELRKGYPVIICSISEQSVNSRHMRLKVLHLLIPTTTAVIHTKEA
jgi:hypothetical protein